MTPNISRDRRRHIVTLLTLGALSVIIFTGFSSMRETTILPSIEECVALGKMTANEAVRATAFPDSGTVPADFRALSADCNPGDIADGMLSVLLNPAAIEIKRNWDARQERAGVAR